MNRKRRTMILIKGKPELAKKLAQEIVAKYEVKILEKPHSGLIMVKMRESARQSLFYLGEILVTECKVQIDGVLGIGIVQDLERERAYHLAVIDAAYNASLEEVKAWEPVLLAEEKEIETRERREMAGVLKTKVDFATMDL